jgi:antibiotic biosynthesis monooxygenase (ABM) superfamily enzyme
MIKVIEGYELKKGADIQPIFLKLRSYAMSFPGFVSVEHIRSAKGSVIAALLYNWEGLQNWQAWESSKLRQQILREAEELLASEPRKYPRQHGPTLDSNHSWDNWEFF